MGQPLFSSQGENRTNPPENYFKTHEKAAGNSQTGFIMDKSCLSNLTVAYDGMTDCVEIRTVDVIYLDFSKASSMVCLQLIKYFNQTMSDGSS